MENNLEGEINPIDPGEIVIDKTHLAARDKFSILKTEAYAMPSSTYVPDDSHTFFVSEDKTLCWANHGRCWNDKGDRVLVASQNSYKEWLLEFCPPDDYDKCGLFFGFNGVCHTYANRELLIGEFDVSVKDASKNFVVVAIFGKYGMGLKNLKALITESFNNANFKVEMTQDMLDTVLARVDNTFDDETEAWKQLIENYFFVPMTELIKQHEGVLDRLKQLVTTLFEGRESIFEKHFNQSVFDKGQFREEIFQLLSSNIFAYLAFLHDNNYIDDDQYNKSKQGATKFLEGLFGVVEGQVEAVQATGELNQELAKKELFM